jgi:ADP-heptose:LPS heptosyltransferase
MQNIYVDKSLPINYCPFDDGKPLLERIKSFYLKQYVKKIIFGLISGRPKKVKPRIPDNPKCVAVATGGNLGGAIISIPLIKGIREKWPNSHLVVISNRQHGIDIIKRVGLGDSYYVMPEGGFISILFKNKSIKLFIKQIRRHKPEVFIGNFNMGVEIILPVLRRIKLTVGQITNDRYDPLQNIYDFAVKYDSSEENWLNGYWNLLYKLDILKQEHPFIKTDKIRGFSIIKSKFPNVDLSEVTIIGIQASVWGKQLFKAYPIEKMSLLCAMLWRKHRIISLIAGAPGQDILCDYLRNKYPDILFLDGIGKFTIDELTDVVSACSAVVSNDSGFMHLSSAVRTPIVALYGMTNPLITWVYDTTSDHCIIHRFGIKPCYHKVNDVFVYCSSRDCIKNISVEFVYSCLIKLIKLM